MDTSSDGWEEEFFLTVWPRFPAEGEAAEDDDSDESGPPEANPKVKGYYKEVIIIIGRSAAFSK